jgi:hypothetical protein
MCAMVFGVCKEDLMCETGITTVLKSVARKRIVENVIGCNSEL